MQVALAREDLVEIALNAVVDSRQCHSVLDQLPVPAYVTDPAGWVTYWNEACIRFAGRTPQVGQDRWCVTWKLYSTAGERIAHDQCPMAQAVHRGTPIRDQIAIAERPDGTRVAFRPYPTPLLDAAGAVTGAVNILIDVTDEQSLALIDQAERCRRLADATYDRQTASSLTAMADGFERTAEDLRARRL